MRWMILKTRASLSSLSKAYISRHRRGPNMPRCYTQNVTGHFTPSRNMYEQLNTFLHQRHRIINPELNTYMQQTNYIIIIVIKNWKIICVYIFCFILSRVKSVYIEGAGLKTCTETILQGVLWQFNTCQWSWGLYDHINSYDAFRGSAVEQWQGSWLGTKKSQVWLLDIHILTYCNSTSPTTFQRYVSEVAIFVVW